MIPIKKEPLKITQYSVKFEKRTVDCTEKKYECESDQECGAFCLNKSVCRLGVCMPEIENDLDCDPKKGLIGILKYDNGLGKLKKVCQSIDPGIVNNNGESIYCINGNKTTDYTKGYPYECKCNDETQIKYSIFSNENVRLNYICLPRS